MRCYLQRRPAGKVILSLSGLMAVRQPRFFWKQVSREGFRPLWTLLTRGAFSPSGLPDQRAFGPLDSLTKGPSALWTPIWVSRGGVLPLQGSRRTMGAPRRGACGWPLRRQEGMPRLRARAKGFAVTITSLSTSAFGGLATGEALHYALPAGCYGRKSITKSHQLHLPYPASGRDAKVSKGRPQSPLVAPAGA